MKNVQFVKVVVQRMVLVTKHVPMANATTIPCPIYDPMFCSITCTPFNTCRYTDDVNKDSRRMK